MPLHSPRHLTTVSVIGGKEIRTDHEQDQICGVQVFIYLVLPVLPGKTFPVMPGRDLPSLRSCESAISSCRRYRSSLCEYDRNELMPAVV